MILFNRVTVAPCAECGVSYVGTGPCPNCGRTPQDLSHQD